MALQEKRAANARGGTMNIETYLDDLGLKYTIFEHKAVHTMEDMEEIIREVEGAHFKNLFVRDQKGHNHYLCVIQEGRQVSLSDLADVLDSGKLSFASDKRLMKYLGLEAGCVGPFGLINDKNHEVTLLLDKSLKNADIVNFHPNRNTAMLSMKKDDFLKYLWELDYDYIEY